MNTFKYNAINANGKQINGTLEAKSTQHARSLLQDKGYYPTHIALSNQKKSSVRQIQLPVFKKKISLLEIAFLTRQLATLINAKLPLADCLSSVLAQTEKKHLRYILSGIRSQILEGNTLANSLKQYPDTFNALYSASVAAGETTGQLDRVLTRLAEYTEAQVTMRNKIKQALIYPSLMLFLSISIVLFLLNNVVPEIIQVFLSTGQQLPKATQYLLALTKISQQAKWPVLITLFISVLLGAHILKKSHWQLRRDRFLLSLPILGPLLRNLYTARYAQILSLLIQANHPIHPAMNIANELIQNKCLYQAMLEASTQVQSGSSIYQAFKASNYFQPMTLQMISHGEKTGQLDVLLARAATEQDKALNQWIDIVLTLFEPAIILIMGGVILFIVLAVLMPIFEMNQLIN